MKEEKRIYIIVPETVQVGKGKRQRNIVMEHGRLMAQSAHVARKLQDKITRSAWIEAGREDDMLQARTYKDITTIVLGVRNSRELVKVGFELVLLAGDDRYAAFKDSNPKFYGSKEKVLTAICVGPITASEVSTAIGHLELF